MTGKKRSSTSNQLDGKLHSQDSSTSLLFQAWHHLVCLVSSAKFHARAFEHGFIFDTKGRWMFSHRRRDTLPFLAFLNSSVVTTCLSILAPTIDFMSGNIGRSARSYRKTMKAQELLHNAHSLSGIAKRDWDSRKLVGFLQSNALLARPTSDLGVDEASLVGLHVRCPPCG